VTRVNNSGCLALPNPNEVCLKIVMHANHRPRPDDFDALQEIIAGSPADATTIQRLVACNWVEEFDGIALLTASGIEAAELLSSGS
jgi:predicted RNA-binding Zn ribbon-like protein